ncbi:MAG: hypothetical protein Q9214_002142, partial [Letrouitia sp. 1 TL-2023]
SALLSFAEPSDTDIIRKLLHSLQGLSSPESFVLVEFPKLLYAGFSWALKHLQNLKKKNTDIAFSEFVAPSHPSSFREIPPPQYTQLRTFSFDLSVIQNEKPPRGSYTAKFNPQRTAQTPESIKILVETVKSTTTLDDGQAIALCDCLLRYRILRAVRSFSFVKGPPGTGKSFLGTALAQVILKANPTQPILVVCQTNKALDGFLEDLIHKGITEVARLGQGSKEEWTAQFNIRSLRNGAKKIREEQRSLGGARKGMAGLYKEGVGWCDAFKSKGELTWNVVKSFFKKQYPGVFQSFNNIKSPRAEELTDLHRARSGDGGYAFEYWCTGGDINDIEGFRDYVQSMLEDCSPPSDSSASESSLSAPNQIRSDNSRAKSTHESVHQDVWALSLAEREQLITKWKAELGRFTTVDKLVEVHRRFCIVKDMQRQAQLNMDARLIKDKQIIGVTTTACAQEWSMLEGLNLSTVICEEAGEITEAQTLTTLLPSIKHAIFIGDPDQLRPQVNQPSLSIATETGRLYRLDESLFERMVSPLSPEVHTLPYSTLSVQRRMHPDIADLMRATEYPFLEDHASTARPPVAGMVHRTFWFDHQYPEDRLETVASDGTSYSNAYECDMICEIVRHLLKTNDFGKGDITILCPYNKQLANIKKKLTETSKCSIFLSDADKESLVDINALPEEELRSSSRSSIDLASMVQLASVDGFQGQESKVVILSTVRSNPQDRTGFLSITNRINVACSRARNGFYILGNSKLLKTVSMWKTIINDFERKGRLGTSFQLHCSRHPKQKYARSVTNQSFILELDAAVHAGNDIRIAVSNVPINVENPAAHIYPATSLAHGYYHVPMYARVSVARNAAPTALNFNLRHLFKITNDGSIEDFRRIANRDDIEIPHCPQCGIIVISRRYGTLQQVVDESNTIDRIYNKLGEKMRGFMLSLQDQRKSLEQGVNGFLDGLKQGPLVGKANGDLIKSRLATLSPLRTELTKFRDEVVVKVEDALCRRLDLANDYSVGANLPFKLRLDYLDCQCSLIGIQDWTKIASRLADGEDRSQHTNVMIDGLRAIATRQAADCVVTLEVAIMKCVQKGLKRLEAEMRLLQVCVQITLATLKHKPQDGISETLNTVSELCMEYPTSAGVLRPVLKSVQWKCEGRQSSYDVFNIESSLLWIKWGNYTLGSLKYCRLGHPYSGADFPQCPECGKRALSPIRQADDTPRPQLQERKFLKMLQEMTAKRMQKRVGDAAGRAQNVQITDKLNRKDRSFYDVSLVLGFLILQIVESRQYKQTPDSLEVPILRSALYVEPVLLRVNVAASTSWSPTSVEHVYIHRGKL